VILISGEVHGVDGVMKRAQTIASYGVKVEIIRAVYGFSGVAMILHNTGKKDGRILHEHLASVFAFRGDKISRLDTYLSDVAMAEAFFG
jgi:ketosteroid isomerase-like protein